MRVIEKFIERLNTYNDKLAIIDCGSKILYSELIEKILFFSGELQKNKVEKGDIVCILGDYSVSSISLFFSLSLNGNIIVPITTQNAQEINERIKITQPEWIFDLRENEKKRIEYSIKPTRHYLLELLIKSQTSGLILFSSGSTGSPKAMVHSLESLLSNYLNKKGKEINFLVFLMFDHIGGLNTLFNCLSMGATITIPENRNPEDIARLIEKFKINVLPASPTFLNLMLISNVFEICDFSSIRMITYGTETMPESILFKLKEKLPRVKLLQTFGTSETGIIKSSSLSSTSTFLKFDDSNQEYKIVNNELWLRSNIQVLGYMNHSNECFTEDGWFMTGDLVEQTKDGYIRIIGRLKEMINVGGEKVLPAEVESVIMQVESVQDCIVKSEKNAITGQIVCAEIILKKGFDFKEERKKIRDLCKLKLDSYKVPVRIIETNDIPYSERYKKRRQS